MNIVALLGLLAALIGVAVAGQPSISFSMTTAQRQLYLSYSAYCGDNVQANWTCYWCNVSTQYTGEKFTWYSNFGNSSGDSFGYVGWYPGDAVQLIYRGTDNLPGWLADADFTKVPYPGVNGAEIHKGFYDIVLGDLPQIVTLVKDAMEKCQTCQYITVSGHSLGAALAAVAAAELLSAFPDVDIVLYNFGSPRVGNDVWAEWFGNSTTYRWRFTNNRDPVPMVPLQSMDFHHHVQEIWYDGSNDQWHFCSLIEGEDPTCEDSVHFPDILDHATYLGTDILDGIPHGCLYTDPSPWPKAK